MHSFNFYGLPPEIQYSILEIADPIVVIRLSQTCIHYQNICSGQYDYLWRKLVFNLIHPMHDHKSIKDFNKKNNTKYENWYEVYFDFHTLNLNMADILVIEGSREENIEKVNYLINNAEFLHEVSKYALPLAAKYGHLNVVKYLVSQGENIDTYKDKALIRAAENNHLDVVKYLVYHEADIRSKNDKALRLSAYNGNLDIVKYLISQGANIHAYYDAALRWAVENDHLHVIEYLVSQGADIHVDNDLVLRWAAERNYLNLLNYLVGEHFYCKN